MRMPPERSPFLILTPQVVGWQSGFVQNINQPFLDITCSNYRIDRMTTDTYVARSDSNNLTGTSTRARGLSPNEKGRPEGRPVPSRFTAGRTPRGTLRLAFVDWRPRRPKRTEGLTTRRLYYNGPAH